MKLCEHSQRVFCDKEGYICEDCIEKILGPEPEEMSGLEMNKADHGEWVRIKEPTMQKGETSGMITKYITFGCGHLLEGFQICIIAPTESQIYNAVLTQFGRKWSFMYNEPKSEKLLTTIFLNEYSFLEEGGEK